MHSNKKQCIFLTSHNMKPRAEPIEVDEQLKSCSDYMNVPRRRCRLDVHRFSLRGAFMQEPGYKSTNRDNKPVQRRKNPPYILFPSLLKTRQLRVLAVQVHLSHHFPAKHSHTVQVLQQGPGLVPHGVAKDLVAENFDDVSPRVVAYKDVMNQFVGFRGLALSEQLCDDSDE